MHALQGLGNTRKLGQNELHRGVQSFTKAGAISRHCNYYDSQITDFCNV
jgi:hypothetical protein